MGETHIENATFAEEFDVSPFLEGLPNDRCQCPHWEYQIEDSIKLKTKDGEETLKAGGFYYMPALDQPKMRLMFITFVKL